MQDRIHILTPRVKTYTLKMEYRMENFMEELKYPIKWDGHPTLKNANLLFIDIETDGLSHKNKIILIGLVLFKKNNLKGEVIQLFNEDYLSEKELLIYLINYVQAQDVDYFISFNGNSFDFPFINARLIHYNLSFTLNKSANIDLYRIAKQYQSILDLPNSKLKSVEKIVGIQREDTISGKDSILLYQAYLETKSERMRHSILLHNYEDIINMVPLLKITHRIHNVAPFKFNLFTTKAYIYSVKLKKSYVEIGITLNSKVSMLDIILDEPCYFINYSNNDILCKLYYNLFVDSRGNTFGFFDSDILLSKPFTSCTDEEKHSLLLVYNDELLIENVHYSLLKIIELFFISAVIDTI